MHLDQELAVLSRLTGTELRCQEELAQLAAERKP
jgi:hypothetical protein